MMRGGGGREGEVKKKGRREQEMIIQELGL
jgi:hypothetical protein